MKRPENETAGYSIQQGQEALQAQSEMSWQGEKNVKKKTDGMACVDLASQKNVGGGTENLGGEYVGSCRPI